MWFQQNHQERKTPLHFVVLKSKPKVGVHFTWGLLWMDFVPIWKVQRWGAKLGPTTLQQPKDLVCLVRTWGRNRSLILVKGVWPCMRTLMLSTTPTRPLKVQRKRMVWCGKFPWCFNTLGPMLWLAAAKIVPAHWHLITKTTSGDMNDITSGNCSDWIEMDTRLKMSSWQQGLSKKQKACSSVVAKGGK